MLPNRTWLRWTALCVLFCAGSLGAFGARGAAGEAEAGRTNAADPNKPAYVPGVVLVVFRKNAPMAQRYACVRRLGLEPDPKFRSDDFARLLIGRQALAQGVDVRAACRALLQDATVEVAEPDYYIRAAQVIPSDQFFNQQWGLHNLGQGGGVVDADIDAAEAWEQVTGDYAIRVAVLDTGVEQGHLDLRDNLRLGPGNVDVFNGDADPADDNGHGTRVAGIIGAKGDNALGVAGVTWAVQMYPYKIMDNAGVGSAAFATQAVNMARAVPVDIINASWDLQSFQSTPLQNAIAAARDAGILFVAAAGNGGNNNDAAPYYPASYNRTLSNVISVAASNRLDSLDPTSNFGAATVDLAAPGAGIITTEFGAPTYTPPPGVTGTSYAAAHVSGAAALYLSRFPSLRPRLAGPLNQRLQRLAELRARLVGTVDRPSGLAGRVATGRLNVNNALAVDTVPPGEPQTLKVTSVGASAVTLRWVASGDDGPVGTAYQYDLRVSTGFIDALNFSSATPVLSPSLVPAPAVSGTPQEALVVGLQANTNYFFALQARDKVGNLSTIAFATPFPVTTSAGGTVVLLRDDAEAATAPAFAGDAPWARTNLDANGGTQSYHDSPAAAGTAYAASIDISLTQISAVELLVANPTLRFDIRGALASGDNLFVEVSTDNGATWGTPLQTFNPGNLPGNWAPSSVSLAAFAGQSVKVRFRLVTDANNQADGVFLDNIVIDGQANLFCGLFDDAEPATTQRFFQNGPGFFGRSAAGPAFSPVQAYDDSPGGNYGPNANKILDQAVSVPLLGFVPELSFHARIQLELNVDFLNVFVSTDDGVTFTRVLRLTGTANTNYVQFKVPLTQIYGQSVRVRFQMTSDAANHFDGVQIDDIRICGEMLTPLAGLAPAAPDNLRLKALTRNSIRLTWGDNSTDETGFRIERGLGPFGPFSEIAIAPASAGTGDVVYLDATVPSTIQSYFYRLRATNACGDSGYTTVAAARNAPPNAPSNLTGQAQSLTVVRLTWIDNSDDEGTEPLPGEGFVIERSDNGGFNFSQIATRPPSSPPTAFGPLTFDDTTVDPNNRYVYRVKSRNCVGDSVYSNTATVDTGPPLPPGPLTGALSAANAATLQWRDNSDNELNFVLEKALETPPGSGLPGAYGVIANPAAAGGIGTVLTHVDSPLAADTVFFYRVKAVNAVGSSAYSNRVIVRTRVPAAPSGLTVTVPPLPTGINQLNLSWMDNSDDEQFFDIRRAEDADFTVNVTGLPAQSAGTTSIVDPGLAGGTKYFYQVRSRNPFGASAWVPAVPVGPPACATTLPPPPGNPSGLSALILVGPPVAVQLTWTDGSTSESGFKIMRATNGGAFVQIDTAPANDQAVTMTTTVMYTDASVLVGNTYEYHVIATNTSGDSAPTNTVAVDLTVPLPPTGLTAVATSATSIRLDWVDNALNEAGFVVQRAPETAPDSGSPDTFVDLPAVIGPSAGQGGMVMHVDNTAAAGTRYFYRVRAAKIPQDSAYSNVASARTAAPHPPVQLGATALSATRVRVDFVDDSDDETGFVVERAPEDAMNPGQPGVFAPLAPNVAAAAGKGSPRSFTDMPLNPDTRYFYQVRSLNQVGQSAPAGPVSVVTPPLAPVLPTNLTATILSATQVQLTWMDNSGGETGFKLETTVGGSSTETLFPANDESVNQIVTVIVPVTAGNLYTYRVRSYFTSAISGLTADSPFSNSATANVIVPVGPGNLTALAISGTQIRLDWQDRSTNENGFLIERSLTSSFGSVTVIPVPPALLAANTNTFTDSGLSPGVTYFYRVRARNAVGDSANSNTASATTLTAPQAPGPLTATAVSNTQIRLDWADNSGNELRFDIDRVNGSSFATGTNLITRNVPANTVTFLDPGLVVGQTYTYRVRAAGAGGISAYSNEATATTITVPGAPTNLVATAISGTEIRLTWNDNSTTETGFRLERKVGAGPFVEVRVLGPNSGATATFIDANLSTGAAYVYQVRAFNSAGNSAYSNQAGATTLSLPNAPSGLTATPVSGARMLLRWTDNSTNETRFRIERSVNGGAFREIASVAANGTAFTDSRLSPGSTYAYRVRAENPSGLSAYSNTASGVAIRRPVRVNRRK